MTETKAQILVVDDTPNWRDYMKTRLETLGGQVYIAESFEQAMEALQQRHYQLAIVDVRLSEGDPNDCSGLLIVQEGWTKKSIENFIVLSAYLHGAQISPDIPHHIFDKTDITGDPFEATVKAIIDGANIDDAP